MYRDSPCEKRKSASPVRNVLICAHIHAESDFNGKKDDIYNFACVLGEQSRQSHRKWTTLGVSEIVHPLVLPKFNTSYIISDNVSF